jgi:hypothetical protein
MARALALAVLLSVPAPARAEAPFAQASSAGGAFRLVGAGRAAPILVDAQDHPGVVRAAGDLQEDVFRVTGVRPSLPADTTTAPDVVIAGTIRAQPPGRPPGRVAPARRVRGPRALGAFGGRGRRRVQSGVDARS